MKAADALRSVKAIYSVGIAAERPEHLRRILDALPGITAERTELEFTMSKDFGERLARIDEHAALILAGIRRGEDAAFVTIGDPMTYSTCSYLLRALRRMEPELEYEIIPGVNSWSALAAATATALVEDREVLRIIPTAVPPEPEKLAAMLQEHGTSVLLKCYRTREELVRLLSQGGYRVTYGANLGLDDEFVSGDPEEIAARPEEYLSMLLCRR